MPLEPKSETEAQDNKPIKYFTQVEHIVILTLPTKVTRPVAVSRWKAKGFQETIQIKVSHSIEEAKRVL